MTKEQDNPEFESKKSTHSSEEPVNEDRIAELNESLEALTQLKIDQEKQIGELQDNWLRAKAETENIRKRSQTEVANAHRYAIEVFLGDILPVKDSLEAALRSQGSSIDSIKDGVELTLKQLNTAFEKGQIEEIDPIGQKLDPSKHQAMTTIDSEEPTNTVISVMQKGYSLHGRLIRPALVTVSKGSSNETQNSNDSDPAED